MLNSVSIHTMQPLDSPASSRSSSPLLREYAYTSLDTSRVAALATQTFNAKCRQLEDTERGVVWVTKHRHLEPSQKGTRLVVDTLSTKGKTKEVSRGIFLKITDAINVDDGLSVVYAIVPILGLIFAAVGLNWGLVAIVAVLALVALANAMRGVYVAGMNTRKDENESLLTTLFRGSKSCAKDIDWWATLIIGLGLAVCAPFMGIYSSIGMGLPTSISCIAGGVATIKGGSNISAKGNKALGRAKTLNGYFYILLGLAYGVDSLLTMGILSQILPALVPILEEVLPLGLPLSALLPVIVNLYMDTGRNLVRWGKGGLLDSKWKLEELKQKIEAKDWAAVKDHLDTIILPYSDIEEIERINGTKTAIKALRLLQALAEENHDEVTQALKDVESSITHWKWIQSFRLTQIFAALTPTAMGMAMMADPSVANEDYLLAKDSVFLTSSVIPAVIDVALPLYRNSPVTVPRSQDQEDDLRRETWRLLVESGKFHVVVEDKYRDPVFEKAWERLKFWKKKENVQKVEVLRRIKIEDITQQLERTRLLSAAAVAAGAA